MPLSPSIYDGGKGSRKCQKCGNLIMKRGMLKCHYCAQEIARQVEQDFKENRGHYLTEAIMATGNNELIDAVVKGVEILDERRKLSDTEDK